MGKRSVAFVIIIFLAALCITNGGTTIISASDSGIGSGSDERPFTYYEFDGIHIYYETDNLITYRELLPAVFDMPKDPLVRLYVIDFYKMDRKTGPYLEAAVFLLAEYKGEQAWHCITMPVTSEVALWGGIIYHGYPKILGKITLQRNSPVYTGALTLNGKTIMTITHNTENHAITPDEKEMFQRIKGIPNLNILNGEIHRPVFGTSSGKYTLFELSRMYPDKIIVEVGTSDLVINTSAAAEYSEKLDALFSIAPSNIVLAYYHQNKLTINYQK